MSGGAEGEYELEPEFYDADAKVRNLEEHGLDGAVVSVDPPFFYYEVDADAAAALAEIVNDGLRDMAARRPDRLWWMATVPLQDPQRAAEVLAEQRSRGCVGVEIGTSTGAARLDEPQFEPFWAAAAELGLPVLLHPAYQHPHPGYSRFSPPEHRREHVRDDDRDRAADHGGRSRPPPGADRGHRALGRLLLLPGGPPAPRTEDAHRFLPAGGARGSPRLLRPRPLRLPDARHEGAPLPDRPGRRREHAHGHRPAVRHGNAGAVGRAGRGRGRADGDARSPATT